MSGSHKTQRRAWTKEEAWQLQELAGDMPFVLVVQQWNIWATRNGIPHRTSISLRRKLAAIGGTGRAFGSWLCLGDVARMLGKHRSTVLQWANAGFIRYHKGGPYSSVNRDDLIQLARERPQLFAGTDRDNLLLLLEDADLADSILERYPRRYWGVGRGRRVRRVDTGQVFATCQAAAQAANLHYTAITKALREGRPAAGMRFEWAD